MKITKLPHGCWMNEYPPGYKYYFRSLSYHRDDGPAVENPDGTNEWWLNGIRIPCTTQDQFERLMRLKAFW